MVGVLFAHTIIQIFAIKNTRFVNRCHLLDTMSHFPAAFASNYGTLSQEKRDYYGNICAIIRYGFRKLLRYFNRDFRADSGRSPEVMKQ